MWTTRYSPEGSQKATMNGEKNTHTFRMCRKEKRTPAKKRGIPTLTVFYFLVRVARERRSWVPVQTTTVAYSPLVPGSMPW